jgi:isoleucyl-tRNA synthetase
MDRYILAELHELVQDVTTAFDEYDVPGATRPVQAFVETLSNWYVRLSRRRFWKSESDSDKLSAYATLYECLVTVSKLIAPTVPFLADAMYRNLVTSYDKHAPISVHLEFWPEPNAALIDRTMIDEMRLVQRLVSLGRAARESVNMGVRQPLAMARFATREAKEKDVVRRLSGLISNELNVKQVEVLDGAAAVVEYKLNPLPSVLGKKFGKDFPRVQKSLREGDFADVRRWAESLLRRENITLEFEGRIYEMTPEEVEVHRSAADGYAIAEDGSYLVALDTRLTEDLIMEGLAREVVRRVQTMRKDADFDISDTITLKYSATERLANAIERFADYIRAETLSSQLEQGEPSNGFHRAYFGPDPDGDAKKDTSIDGEALTLAVKRM